MHLMWDFETKRFIVPRKKPVHVRISKAPKDDIVSTDTAKRRDKPLLIKSSSSTDRLT